MKRYVSVWLPNWSIERFGRLSNQHTALNKPGREGGSAPLVLVAPAQGGIRIMAACGAAQAKGITVGQLLADARTLYPQVSVADHDPVGDETALKKLAYWLIRYSPWTACDPSDGLLIDITGCAHLLGGEYELGNDLLTRLHRFGLSARIAIAGTIGAAWAISHHSGQRLMIADNADTAHVLRPYPISALRIGGGVVDRVSQVGLKTIGSVLDKPRAPLAARYGRLLMTRLDQALGTQRENLSPLSEPPDYRVSKHFLEPIQHLEAIETNLADITTPLVQMLNEASIGARRFDLVLYRVDGDVKLLMVRTSALTADKALILRLFAEKLKTVSENYDVGFGIDQVTLSAYEGERTGQVQHDFSGKETSDRNAALQTLLDRYSNRFGPGHVGQFLPQASYIPERSERLTPIADMPVGPVNWPGFLEQLQGDHHLGRPIALLPRPEPITAIAEVPDGPPVVFEWRRLKHRIICAEGPERIAPEWWSRRAKEVELTRDYYRVEDRDGYRYWLYRQGLYERGETPRWFMHGFFA